MEYLSNNIIENKKVILRCDFNVPVVNGVIIDNSKIIKSLNTIKHLLYNNNQVVILSHFGRIKREEDKKNNSLKIVYEELKKYINVEFIEDPLNLEKTKDSSNKCYLVENTRFTDIGEKKESKNDLELAKYWSSFGEVFVLDAFGTMHRAHSSTAGIGKFLPTYLGFLVEDEINNLKPLVGNVEHPFVVIMGGAKASDKIKIIDDMLHKCDKLVITGGILNTFLKVAGKKIGKSIVGDEETLEQVKHILDNYENKIYFTDYFVVKRGENIVELSINDILDNDIIYDNVLNLNDVIKDAKIIFLNGTCGKYEESVYAKGTKKLLEDLKNCEAKVYIGGGDTTSAVNTFGYINNFEYLSSGGGATLEYVSSGKLQALEWIKENK